MQQPQQFDYLIVGQGLAGTLVGHFLEKKGCRAGFVDPGGKDAASRVAAGIINPITGRRYVKSWRVDKLIPFAEQTYRELEARLGDTFFHPRRILRALFNRGEENDWLARSAEPGYARYILDEPDLGRYAAGAEPAFAYGEVRHSAQVDIGRLTLAYRQRLIAEGRLLSERLDYDALEVEARGVRYRHWQAPALVFCEGSRAVDNPFFNYLPFGGAKGEVLLIRIPEPAFEKILKQRVFIVPLQNGLYWVGATYDWQFEDSAPTPAGRRFLEERLQDLLRVPYEVVDHRAAVRPTVKDRRPFLGRHPDLPALFLFNGLGTKGASLGPFWAHHFVSFLLENSTLDAAVDIRRFASG